MSFWDQLLKQGRPIVGMSPMDGVTDCVMRYMTSKYGKPDVVFSEFVSVDALAYAKEDKSVDRVMRAFIRAADVGPLTKRGYEVAQVFGHTPALFYQAAVMIATLGFDGMDINMGCPAHKVEEQGSGAGLIRYPEVAKEIVLAAKAGMKDYSLGKISVEELPISDKAKAWVVAHQPKEEKKFELPVSVKTRIGVDTVVGEEWMKTLMEVNPAMISLHGRTLKQLYQGMADWEEIKRAAKVVHSLGGHILGNGDIMSREEGMSKAQQYGVDGFLIGRAAEGNPAVFAGVTASREQKIAWILEHTRIYEQVFGADYLMPLRKHLAWYAHGFPGALELRTKLVLSKSREEIERIVSRLGKTDN